MRPGRPGKVPTAVVENGARGGAGPAVSGRRCGGEHRGPGACRGLVGAKRSEGDVARRGRTRRSPWPCPRWTCRPRPPAEGVVAIVGVAWVMVTGLGRAARGDRRRCWRHRCRWPSSGRCPPRWSRTGPRWRWPAVSGLAVAVNTGVPVHVVSVGANRWKVTVPVGVNPPLTVAVSEMEVPTAPPAEGGGRDGRGGLGDDNGLGRAARGDRRVVGVTVVGGRPVEGAHGGGRERARGGAARGQRLVCGGEHRGPGARRVRRRRRGGR